MPNRRLLTLLILIVIMLPIMVLKNLTFRKSALWGWLFILFIGSISIVAAIVRYGALRAVWGQPKASVTHTIDVSSMVEITTSLLAVCSPSLRVFFRGKNKPHRPIERDVRDISTHPDLLSTVKSAMDPRSSDVDSQKHLSPVPENQLASSDDLPMGSGTSTLTSFTRSVWNHIVLIGLFGGVIRCFSLLFNFETSRRVPFCQTAGLFFRFLL